MGWEGLEGYGSQEEAPDSAREFREGFLEEEMFELCCEGPAGANKVREGRGIKAERCVESPEDKVS